MMPDSTKIFIGTSGWSYPRGEGTWNGYFYPAGKINELEYYSHYFSTVEINSTFYRPPDPRVTKHWAQVVPNGFLFTVKLWQKFTHPKMFEATTGDEAVISIEDVRLFQTSIEPLDKAGKLGAILAQFPPSFKNNTTNVHILTAIIRHFNWCRLAVELRHNSWSDDERTCELLRNNNVAWVRIDEPQFPSSVSQELPLTGDIAYFRYHGRNVETWWSGDNETRYKYLYSDQEIAALSKAVRKASQETRMVFVFFNNHWKAYAPRNAVDIISNLGLPMREVPSFGTGRLFED
jgi:uncharacterized protein YecE (DUF72 family)